MNALLQLYPGDRGAVLAGYVLAEITILVALAYLVARRVARGRPAVRYGVWLCALACVMLSPLTTLLLDRAGLVVWTVPVLRDAKEQSQANARTSDAVTAEPAPAPRRMFEAAPFAERSALPDAALLPSIAPPLGAPSETTAATPPAPAAAAQPANAPPAPLSGADRLRAAGGAVVAVWLAGIALFLIRLVRGWCIVAGLKRDVRPLAAQHKRGSEIFPSPLMRQGSKTPPSPLMGGGSKISPSPLMGEGWGGGERSACGRAPTLTLPHEGGGELDARIVKVLESVRRQLGLARLPRVVTSRRVSGPVVVGVLRPMVILPEEVIPTLGPEQMRDILVHECAHVVRRDHWVSLLQRVVEMLFWPHVLVHYLNRQLSRAREEVCDNYVLGSGDAPGYARTLLTLSENAPLARPTPAGIGLLQPRWRLEDRVAGLLDTRRDLMLRMSRWAVGAVVTTFLAVTVLVAGTKMTRTGQEVTGPVVEANGTTTTQPRSEESEPAVEEHDDLVVVRGRVLDPEGNPFAGATVRAQTPRWVMPERLVSEDFETPTSEVKTDDQGRFTVSFTKQPFGDLSRLDRQWQEIWKKTRIAAVAPGFGPGWVEYETLEAGDPVTLRLVRDLPIKGRVVDLEGRPIAGARVKVGDVRAAENEDMTAWLEAAKAGQVRRTVARLTPKQVDTDLVNVPETVTTDEQGRFEIHGIGRERNVELAFQGEGVAHKSVTVVTRPMEPFERVLSPEPAQAYATVFGAEFTFAAAPSRPVQGTVVDAESGEPLAGVAVESYALADYPHSNHRVLKTTTDEQGRFRLVSMPKGEGNRLLVVPSDEQPYFMQEVDVPNPPGLGPATVEVQLHRGIWITGRVTDKATGEPVHARLHYLPLLSNKYAQALPEFDKGRADGYQTRYQTRRDGTYRLVGLPGPSIVGAQSILRHYRYGVGAEHVDAPMHQETYEWEAHFATYRNPVQPSRKWPNVMRQINPAADAESVVLDLEMDPGLSVRINMVDPNGRPISGVQVDGRSPRGWSETVDSATFEAIGFGPDDRRTIILHHEQRDLGWVTRIGPGDAASGPITVTLQPCATVSGRLLRQDGTPYANLEIQAYVLPAEDNPGILPPVTTDSDGRFRYTMMSGGKYWVRARWLGVTVYDELAVKPGETRDLGELTYAGERGFVSSAEAEAKPKEESPQGEAQTRSQPSEPSAAESPQPRDLPSDVDHVVTVRGRVLGPDGKPFGGAALYVTPGRRFWDEAEPAIPQRTLSAADGRFEFGFPKREIQDKTSAEPWRDANIVAVAEGFGPAWAKVGELTGEGLTLRLAEDDLPITGRVLDLEGRPIAGVTVQVMQMKATTDLSRLIEAMKGPHNPDLMEKLDPRSMPVHVPELHRPVTTGPDGRFRLEGIGRERLVSLAITGPTIEHRWVSVMTRPGPVIEIGPPSRPIHGADFEYVARPTQPIVGTVRAGDTGQPLPGVRVTGGVDEGFFNGHSSATTTTDGEGEYRLVGLPDGKPYWLHMAPPTEQPYFTVGRKVADRVGLEPLSADFALVRGIPVRGTLRDGATGKPVRGQVWYYPGDDNPRFKELRGSLADHHGNMRTTWTDADGAFAVLAFPGEGAIAATALDAGQYTTVDLEELEGTTAPGTSASGINAVVPVNVPDDARGSTQDVTLDRGRELGGMVLDATGQPLSGVEVLGLTSQFSNPSFVQTLDTAQFTIAALRPPRPRTLIFQHRERNLAKTLVVRGDEAEPLRVQLEPCAALAGRLVDEGNPRSDFVVTAGVYVLTQAVFLGARNPAPVTSDADGRFRIDGLVPHLNYRVHASSKDERAGGEIARDLTLQPGEVKDLGDVSFEPFAQQPPRESTTSPPAPAADKQAEAAQQRPDTVTVSGRVLDPDGGTVPEVGLYWGYYKTGWRTLAEDVAWRRFRADGEGRFALEVPTRDFHKTVTELPLVAYAPGFGLDWVILRREDKQREVTLRLQPDQPIRGRLVDTEGRPVQGATVAVESLHAPSSGSLDGFLTAWKADWKHASTDRHLNIWLSQIIGATTDADGRFEMRGVGRERVANLEIRGSAIAAMSLWVVNRNGFDPRPFNEAALARQEPDRRTPLRTIQLVGPTFEHVVEPALTVEGLVYTGAEKKPVAAAHAYASASYGTMVIANTDAQGRFVLPGLRRGVGFNVTVELFGENNDLLRQTQWVEAAPGASTVKLDFELRHGVVVQGRVTDSMTGEGVRRAGILFVPLPGNPYSEQPGYDGFRRNRTLQLVDPDGRFRIVTMPGPGVLMVQVLTFETVNGHEVNAYRQASFSEEDQQHVVVTESGEDRYFTGVDNTAHLLVGENAVKYVDLAPDDGPVTCNFVLDRGLRVDVEILDTDGRPLEAAFVAGVTDVWPRPSRVGGSRCTILALGADRPRKVVFLHPERRLAGSLTLPGEEASPVSLRLAPTGSIKGRAVYQGVPLEGARVTVNYSGRAASELLRSLSLEQGPPKTDEDGRFQVENVIPGERFALDFKWDDSHYRAELSDEQRYASRGKTIDYGDVELRKLR